MKKILFLTPHLPSLRAGGEKFTYLLLNELSKDYIVDLIYYKYNEDPCYNAPNHNVNVLRIMKNSIRIKLYHTLQHPMTHPIFSVRFDSELLKYLQHRLSIVDYDLLYLDHSQMFMYGKYFPNIQKILMAHDVMIQRYERMGNRVSKRLIISKEKELMNMPNSTIFTFSQKDNDIIKRQYGVKSYSTNFFLDNDIIEATPQKIERQIVFIGKWNRPDNLDGLIWFFENVYQLINKDIRIVIYGKWLPEPIIKKINKETNIKYMDFVENPYMEIANSLTMVSPLFSGAGVKVKVVESLACGTPVVGTNIAFEGISKDYEPFMKLADDAESFAKLINDMSISIAERRHFKERFLQNYHNHNIVNFINQL